MQEVEPAGAIEPGAPGLRVRKRNRERLGSRVRIRVRIKVRVRAGIGLERELSELWLVGQDSD